MLLFVHGYRGHTHWWDWIAPAFTDRFRVAAVDLAGMGDSDARARYSADGFAGDVLGVLAGLAARDATIVGHSYGGTSVLCACALDSEHTAESARRIRRALILDTYVRFPESDSTARQPSVVRSHRPYPSYEAARARYRLIPDQPVQNTDLLEHVARTSVRCTANGWRWRFDSQLPSAPTVEDGPALLSRVQVPVDVIYGERSAVLDEPRAMATVAALPHGRGPFAIPEAHHHIMIDQPMPLIGLLSSLLD